MHDTSYFRTLAREMEARGQWGAAIDAWNSAIEIYPFDPAVSEIAKRDIASMESRREECQRQFFPA